MNVLEIISDQHQATCLGCEGHPQAITPNLDAMAGQGMRFAGAYTQNPICTPSRVSIFSGQYCHNHGYYGLSGPMPASLPSFFSHFRAHGYRTAGIGNLHTPDDPRNWLADHLDVFADSFHAIDGEVHQTPFFERAREAGWLDDEDFHFAETHREFMMEGMPSRIPFELSQEGWCVEEAVKFLDSCGKQPFCMQVSLERPHTPCFPSQQFWDLYPEDIELPDTIGQDPSGRPPHFQTMFEGWRGAEWGGRAIEPKTFLAHAKRLWRGYLASITQVDHAVGLLLSHLDKLGLAERTIVIYHADHGAYATNYGLPEKAPGICSESVCRIPFIWRVPGVTRSDAVSGHLVENVDLAPTIASLCGLPAMDTVDGKDITGLLRSEDAPVRNVAVTEHPWSKALRRPDWRFVHYQPEMFDGNDVGELYNMRDDPHETRNLYHDPAHQETVHECRRLLLEWLIRTTRNVSTWPALNYPDRPFDYSTVADGKESNAAGPAQRVASGMLNYL